jgi:single-strand DNA-binding protein
MSGLNKAILIGNLGADPEVKFTQNGQAILKLRLATSEKWKNKDGELQERTEWHNVVMWGPRAEALGKILAKGRTIYVEGRIQTRSYEDKDGVKKYATDINANELLLLGGRGEGGDRQESGGQHRQQGRPQGSRKPADDFPDDSFNDGDIPF